MSPRSGDRGYSAALLIAALLFAAPAARAATVEVDVGNVVPGEGDVRVALCDSALDPQQCQRTTTATASGASVHVAFSDVPPGRYAVAAYQDVDRTGVLRKGKLGIPLEPFAFSNGAGLTGRPKFEAAAFEVGGGDRRVRLNLFRPRKRTERDQ